MTALIIFFIILLLGVVLVQLGRVSELAAKIRGEEEVELQGNNRTALMCMVFLVAFLIFCVVSAYMYKDVMLGYGPHSSASEHGGSIDSLFNITLFFTGIVFIITHIYLFWFSYKYREDKSRVAYFFPHNTTLEVVWTIIPFFVLTFLVVRGLQVWNNIMPDVDAEEDYIEIEATGYQFAWDIRYPGADGKLGTKEYTRIGGINNLGQVWEDPKNIDDFQPAEIWLPRGKKVRVRITAKDVLHNFYLPHFRVKMDAVPGLPTYFIFTPKTTTVEYRQKLKEYPEWNEPYDPDDPDGSTRWEEFNYELACAELCGKGHYSMKRIVKIVEPEEYEEWLAKQNSYYMQNIRNTEEDPFKGQILPLEVASRKKSFISSFENALEAKEDADKVLNLEYVFFETGSAVLKDDSKYELDNVVTVLNQYKDVAIEIGGHTDSQGDDGSNLELSKRRATSVLNYLTSKGITDERLQSVGYGEVSPVETNDTAEGREKNRRTELKIKS